MPRTTSDPTCKSTGEEPAMATRASSNSTDRKSPAIRASRADSVARDSGPGTLPRRRGSRPGAHSHVNAVNGTE
jgi:hypothetical protein